jgi:hypothetical protein
METSTTQSNKKHIELIESIFNNEKSKKKKIFGQFDSHSCYVEENNFRNDSKKLYQQTIKKLRKDTDLPETDFTIVCSDNVEIQTHSFILQLRCSYFRFLFHSNMNEVKERKLVKPNITSVVMQKIIKYLYCGICKINVVNIIPILLASIEFDIQELKKQIVNIMETSISRHTVCLYYQTCFEKDINMKLYENIIYFIKKNTDILRDQSNLDLLTRESLLFLLSQKYLPLLEEDKFQLIMKKEKLQYDSSSKEIIELYSSVLDYKNMSSKFLTTVIKPMNLFETEKFCDILCQVVNPDLNSKRTINWARLMLDYYNENNTKIPSLYTPLEDINWENNNVSSFYTLNDKRMISMDINKITGTIYILTKSSENMHSRIYTITKEKNGFSFDHSTYLEVCNSYTGIIVNQNNGNIILHSANEITIFEEDFQSKKDLRYSSILKYSKCSKTWDENSRISIAVTLDHFYLCVFQKGYIDCFCFNLTDFSILTKKILLYDKKCNLIRIVDTIDNNMEIEEKEEDDDDDEEEDEEYDYYYDDEKRRIINITKTNDLLIFLNKRKGLELVTIRYDNAKLSVLFSKEIAMKDSTCYHNIPKLYHNLIEIDDSSECFFIPYFKSVEIYDKQWNWITEFEIPTFISSSFKEIKIHPITKHLILATAEKILFVSLN